MHRFEETNERSAPCKPDVCEKCIGGYARAVTVIKQLMEDRKETNPIYLNAGDNFQGTLWYNILKWNATSYFLNLLKADAMVIEIRCYVFCIEINYECLIQTLGNHEFDHDIDGVIPFLESIQSPIIISNVDDSEEPTFQGKYMKSLIIERYNTKIGVLGVILSTTYVCDLSF